MKKLVYIYSDVDSSHLIEAIARFVDKDKYEMSHIFLGRETPTLFHKLKSENFAVEFLECAGKKDLPKITANLTKLFRRTKPDIVHANLFNATAAGLVAARIAGVRQRVHTRHHSVEAHKYNPHAVYYDKFFNWLSTDIIAITDMVARILIEQERVEPAKVATVRHGFDWRFFDNALAGDVDLKTKYELDGFYPIVGVISRLIHWKGIQYTIPAFQKLLADFPNAKLVLANASGAYRPELEKLLAELPANSYKLIEFEKDVFSLYKTFDVFVHAPIGAEYEAFGQVYVEPLVMRVPSVFTLSGVAADFIRDQENALVVPFCDSDAIYQAVKRILSDKDLRAKLIETGDKSARETFHARRMVDGLEQVYDK